MLVFHRRGYLILILLCVLLTETWAWLHWLSDAHGQGSPPTKEKLDEKTIHALIGQLGDDSFEKRDEAQKKLVAAGKAALPLLRKAATESADAETRERAMVAARMISAAPGPDKWKPGSWVFDLAHNKDGKSLAVACQDRTVRIFDVNTGTLRKTLNGHTNYVYCVLFSTGDKTLVSCSGVWRNPGDQGEIIVWDLASGKARHTMKTQQGGFVWVVYAPDEKHLYTCGNDGTIRKWDTGKQTEALSANGGGPIRRLMFTPDRKQLASLGFDGTVRFWDPDTLQEVRQVMAHPSGAGTLAFSPDGKYLITCSRAGAPPFPGEIKVWDMATLTEKRAIKGHKSRVLSLAVSPDSKLLAMGGGEYAEYGEVMIFDLESGAVRANLPDHEEWVEAVSFSPDGSRLATGGGFGAESRGEVRVWNVKGLLVKGE
jgi:WD40 repeat protein